MQEHFIDVDGNRIRYLDSGVSKNNLVLLHGLGASAERWSKVIPDFAKHYHVIVPD
ncbi:MAG: alpha/beta fold hydrolase, partial [Nitrosarchaeum sp.]